MPGQLALPGFESAAAPLPRPAAPATDRLFFALFPEPAAAARISRLTRQLQHTHGLRGRPLAPERLHVTLHALGDYPGFPEDVAEAAKAAAEHVAALPFDLSFDQCLSFERRQRNRPLVLTSGERQPGLDALHDALGAALEREGLRCRRDFTPHVTLLYDDHAVEGHGVERVRWTAREFVLVDSLLGRTQHVPLARWPLDGRLH